MTTAVSALGMRWSVPLATPLIAGHPNHPRQYVLPSRPVVAPSLGLVIVNDGTTLSALRIADGSPAWQARSVRPGRPIVAFSVVGTSVYVCDSTFLRVLNAADGTIIRDDHNIPGGGPLEATPPVVSARIAYVADYLGVVYAVRLDNWSTLWSFQTPTPLQSPLVLCNGQLVFVSAGQLIGLDALAGTQLWTYRPLPEDQPQGNPRLVANGDRVFVTFRNAHVLTLNATGPSQIALVPNPDALVAFADVACSDDNMVFATGGCESILTVSNAAHATVRWPSPFASLPSAFAMYGGVPFGPNTAGGVRVAFIGTDLLWSVSTAAPGGGCQTQFGVSSARDAMDWPTNLALPVARWTATLPGMAWATPVLYGDTMYVPMSASVDRPPTQGQNSFIAYTVSN